MTKTKEFAGKNVDLAVRSACKELKLSKDALNYHVVSHGSTGIFGIVGVKKAKISVILPDAEPAPETETPPAENETVHREPDNAAADSNELFVTEILSAVTGESEAAVNDESGPESAMAALGKEALERIAGTIASAAQIRIAQADRGRIRFHIEGGNPALLIGKHGQTLDAIQYIIEKIINRQHPGRIRVQVDVENYLENRRNHLRELALKLADKTKKTGKPSTIGQMNANDRRTIHLALKDDPSVRTKSVGDGYVRKLVIFPKKNTYRKKQGA